MPRQLTVRLPDDLSKSLEARSRRTGERASDIVRAALNEFLRPALVRGRAIDRVRHLIGALDTGQPDLAERHREHILESLSRGR